MQKKVNVSIVLYNNSIDEVRKKVDLYKSWSVVNEIIIVDNSPKRIFIPSSLQVIYHYCPENLGYGAGHNVAIKRTISSEVEYHLVVNLDVHFGEALLRNLVEFMESNEGACVVQPSFIFPDGTKQYLAKYLPNVTQMMFRMIGLGKLKLWNIEINTDELTTPFPCPYLSGCFLLMRRAPVTVTGMFDERYFMYPEDIDLSRRYATIYGAWVIPSEVACHEYGGASKKSLRMFLIHFREVLKYYRKWGFILDIGRKNLNAHTRNYLESRR
ncbi:glycosyltransferase family 2 protein [bacterium]|nr:glycosyltransferase family 2 protein [bacterium]